MTFLDNFRKEYIDKTAFIEIKNFYKIFFHFNLEVLIMMKLRWAIDLDQDPSLTISDIGIEGLTASYHVRLVCHDL